MPDVSIKGWSGTDFEYQDVPVVWLKDPASEDDAPVLVPFTYGEAVSKTVEELDFADGDMVVAVPEGTLITALTIRKPENLAAENIAKDVEVAGIVGTNEGGGAALDDALRYFQCHIDPVERTVTLYSVRFDLIYADTGSYDVTIPDTLCGFQVVISA